MNTDTATDDGASSDDSIVKSLEARLYPSDGNDDGKQRKVAPQRKNSEDNDDDLDGDFNPQDQNVEDEELLEGEDEENAEQEDDVEVERVDAAELAQHLGLDESQLTYDEDGNLMVNVKVDGKESKASISDVIKSYQLQQHVNQKSMKLSEIQKEFEGEIVNVKRNLFTQHHYAVAASKLAEDMLVKDYNSIDWEGLKHANPAQYAVLRTDFSEKATALKQLQQRVASEAMMFLDGMQNEMTQADKDRIAEQRQLMLIDNPAWVNDNVRKKAQAELRDFVVKRYGFSEADMHLVTDRRLMQLIQDAHRYNVGKQKLAEQQRKQLPKFQKKGQNFKNQTVKARTVKSANHAFRKSGTAEDLAKALESRM